MGRRIARQASTILSGRQFATAVDGTVITFRCKREGHTYRVDFASKRRRLTARLGPGACKMMASWWSEAKGGCIGHCPKCDTKFAADKDVRS